MRSKLFATVAAGAPLLLVLAVSMLATGCQSCNPCANPCAANPCEANPCAANPCEANPCANPCEANPCGTPCETPCETPCAPQQGDCGPFPPQAKAGEAWCCVWIPPVYTTTTEKVCVCPEQCQKEWVPPTYETVNKQVCVQPECSRDICTPAEYQTVEECVEVCPARTEWQRVDCPPGEMKGGEQQKDCWALVTIPPQYEKRCKQVCVKEASTRVEKTPAVYETVCEQVEKTCGYYKDLTIPAKYEDKQTQVCSQPGRWEWRLNEHCAIPQPQVNNPCTPPPPAGTTAPAPMPTPDQPK